MAPQSNSPTNQITRLVVFSDDWGRSPSSCQHLIGHLLDRFPTLWVNTIGTRGPRLSVEDLKKIVVKLSQWVVKNTAKRAPQKNPMVINPQMYPGFRKPWQRRLNAGLIARTVNHALGPRCNGEQRIAITTVPITADLVDRLEVDRWIYYCVDDFSVWPGLDGTVINVMERHLASKVDRVVAVSEILRQRLQLMGRNSELLTHGIDLVKWGFDPDKQIPKLHKTPKQHQGNPAALLPTCWSQLEPPVLVFWGVVDQRLDSQWCQALAKHCGSLVLVGPHQSPDKQLFSTPRIHLPGAVPFTSLPTLAQAADALVMPYVDMPSTRAIQPLKLKEYLATGKPTIVRRLPATIEWSDAADVVESIDQLIKITQERIRHGTPAAQLDARRRLRNEAWSDKSQRFEQIFMGRDEEIS